MSRWYLWLALLLTIPVAMTLGGWLLLDPFRLKPESLLAALAFGLLFMGVAMPCLRPRIRDDRGTRLSGGIVLPPGAMVQSLGLVALLASVSWFGWCGSCIGRGFFEMVIDNDIPWPRYDPPYPPSNHPSIPIVESIILIVSLLPGLLAAVVIARVSRKRYTPEGRLSRGECGRCGYNLHGLETEEDGCRICPECGAAWRKRIEPDDM